ncbi:MAG: 4-hydroxybenzoate octaprenyltransferase [Proteobacteria bacterium]|nr:4-hydroxybenzoate octaprenyltransferase [Pseudomonadota bacterium]
MPTKLNALLQLTLHGKPIAALLLLWPTLAALWIAGEGSPKAGLLALFLALAFLIYCADSVINTPSPRGTNPKRGALGSNESVALLAAFCLAAFLLLLPTNTLTITVSLGGVVVAALYSLAKRYTSLAALISGAALSFGVPMAFAAQRNDLPPALWLLFLGSLLWAVAYDIQRGMASREQDLKRGKRTTAILLGDADRMIIATLQAICLFALFMAGRRFELGLFYTGALAIAAAMFIYQQRLIGGGQPTAYLKAFRHNNWVGMVIFAGIILHYHFASIQ